MHTHTHTHATPLLAYLLTAERGRTRRKSINLLNKRGKMYSGNETVRNNIFTSSVDDYDIVEYILRQYPNVFDWYHFLKPLKKKLIHFTLLTFSKSKW